MRLRRLGSSSLEISVIGIGSWVFGGTKRSWGWGPQDDAESVATIMRAVDLGINWIDNALSYGFGHSDEIVAREFHGRRLAANMALTEALAPVADRHSTAITSVALS